MILNALVLSLPTRNSTLRMRMWRTLKEAGCGALRDGVYVLPAAAAGAGVLTQMESEIRSAGGFAMALELKLKSAGQRAEVHKLFDRSAEYGALVERISAATASLPRSKPRKAKRAVERLQRALEHLGQVDFFPGRARRQAEEAMSGLARSLEQEFSGGEPVPAKKRLRALDPAQYQNRVWATRKDPWVDRLASGWLIRRFIDRNARFVWIERPRDLPKKAVGFDFDGAEFTHVKDRVTFEVLLASFRLENDPALVGIGAAVHFLDTGGIPVADAKGLETVLRGIKEKAHGDDALLAAAMRIFDLFYSAYTQESAQRPAVLPAA
ncbi:MAG TPA: chromate resistance protein ChrB domain-containing protein [Burkholderiales bacterium]|nr:chromate resistance protein ChrB domain-containing protein [Burkholderiales bacterium]